MITPLFHIFTLSLIFYNNIVSCIVGLFCACSPSAIRWFIVSVVVYAINFMFWGWKSPHVCKEILKGIPTVTDFDSTTTIIFIKRIFRIITSFFQSLPSIILTAIRHTVCSQPTHKHFFMNALARFCGSFFQTTCTHNGFIATITLAKESWHSWFNIRRTFYSNQSSESLSSKINEFWHDCNYTTLIDKNKESVNA